MTDFAGVCGYEVAFIFLAFVLSGTGGSPEILSKTLRSEFSRSNWAVLSY